MAQLEVPTSLILKLSLPRPWIQISSKKSPWFHLGMEFETEIWAVVQNLDGTMESPFCELKPATHMENRLTAPQSLPHLQGVDIRRGGSFLLILFVYFFSPTVPGSPCLHIHTIIAALVRDAPATFMQGWESIIRLILTPALRETQGLSLRGKLARPFAFLFEWSLLLV